MSEFISLDAAIDEINDRITSAINWGSIADDEEIKIRAEQAIATFCEASLTIKKLQSLNITFCRDCRHYYEEHSNIWKEPLCYCRKWLCSHPTLPEGFCNYGEVKG